MSKSGDQRGHKAWRHGDDAPPASDWQGLEGGSPVLAAVIRRENRYLAARRPEHKHHGGLWEFPGGKMLAGESWLDAARRELAEELGVEVRSVAKPLMRTRDPGSEFIIVFVPVEIEGEPLCIEHAELLWGALDELARLDLAPADRAFVDHMMQSPQTSKTRRSGDAR